MFESKHDPLVSFTVFLCRLFIHFCIGLGIVAVGLGIGILGFHYFETIDWLDSFENSAMILSTMGPVIQMKTLHGKTFAAFYALFSGLVFVTMMTIVFAPVLHRFLHKFHARHPK